MISGVLSQGCGSRLRFVDSGTVSDHQGVKTASLVLVDPTEAPAPKGAFDRFWLKLIRDPRNLPFGRVQVLSFVVMLALAIWMYIDFNICNALLFLAWHIRQLGPY
jgi:hypothetical protein